MIFRLGNPLCGFAIARPFRIEAAYSLSYRDR
jgi:hypothetical protein